MGVRTKEQLLSLIQEHQSQIRNLDVRRLGLFGSFVHQQQTLFMKLKVHYARRGERHFGRSQISARPQRAVKGC